MASNTIQILITAKDQASKTIKQVADESANASNKQSRLGAAVASTGKAALRVGAAGMVALAAGATAASKAAWDQVRAVEDGSFALRAYEQDAGKVNQILGELVAYARSDMGVLFQREDLFKAASNLRGFGEEADKVTGRVKILSKGVALGITNFDELSQIVGRAAQSGKLTAEQYDQLAYRGIILDGSLRGAAVGADELYQALDKALPDDILKGRADTIEGRMIRLQSAFRDVGLEILGVDRESSKFIEGGLGDRLLDAVTWATDALKQLPGVLAWMREEFIKVKDQAIVLATAVWDYLGPKVMALWGSIQNNLIPALTRLWREVIEPMLPVIGTVLVVALGAATDALNIVVGGASWLIERLLDLWGMVESGNPIIWGLIGVLGSLVAALAISKGVAAFSAAMTAIQMVHIPAAVGAFTSMTALMAAPIVLPALAIGAALASIAAVWNAWSNTKAAIEQERASGQAEMEASINIMRGARQRYDRGEISFEQMRNLVGIAAKASGTNYAAGGLTLVGERGPELVNLPRGSQVTQAYRTAQTGSGAAPSQVIVNITGPVSFNDRSDIDYFAERMSKTQRLAKAGMA